MNPIAALRPPMKKMKRTIIHVRFWKTCWAVTRYIPRAFVVKRVHGLDFFKPESIDRFINRVKSIRPNSTRQWGTMSPAGMLHHLNLAVGGALGYYQLEDESYYLGRTVFKWILVDWYSEQPLGLRLPLSFVIPADKQFDFEYEQNRLLEIITAAGSATAKDFGPHPFFGKMSVKEWGKLYTMHVDYHLRQYSA